jgi:hypothetical protein
VLLCCALAAYSQDPPEPGSVEGLSLRIESTNVVLTWPSDPRESFLVLGRSNAMPETQWTILANSLRASPLTKQTNFRDAGGAALAQPGQSTYNLLGFYRVIVLPDFWFNVDEVRLDGGPQRCGEDFIPFYHGNPGWDEFSRIFGLHVDLVIDAERATEEEAIALPAAVDEDIERVNFGTMKKPRWVPVSGFWLRHDLLANGPHTLQLRTSLRLNNLVGLGDQFLTLTNSSVRVWTTNSITFPDWTSEVGANMRITAKSTERRANWRIDIRDHKGKLLARKTGTTTNGDIAWTWDLRDRNGDLHDDLDKDPWFQPSITTWSISDSPKGGELLTKFPKMTDSRNWWVRRLGKRYTRKTLTPEEYRKRALYGDENPLRDQVPPRPLSLSWPAPTAHVP